MKTTRNHKSRFTAAAKTAFAVLSIFLVTCLFTGCASTRTQAAGSGTGIMFTLTDTAPSDTSGTVSAVPLSAGIGTTATRRVPVAVDGGSKHSVILYNDGTVVTIGDDTYGQRSTSGWRSIVQISTFANHTLGLKSDGTVKAAGDNSYNQCNVEKWTNIVAVAAGSRHSVGLRADGTVVAVGANEAGQCNVSGWTGIKAIAATNTSTFALTNEGKVLVCGSFYNRNMNNWSDITSISVSNSHVVGVHSDGTLSAVGSNDRGQLDNLGKWMDTQQVAVGYGFTAGLRATGGVWVHGCDEHNEHAAMSWQDVVYLGSGTEHLLGIKADGTLVAKGTNDCGQCDVYRLNQMLDASNA